MVGWRSHQTTPTLFCKIYHPPPTTRDTIPTPSVVSATPGATIDGDASLRPPHASHDVPASLAGSPRIAVPVSASTQPATTPLERIPPVHHFQHKSLLLRWNQHPLVDATLQPPCLPAGVRSGQGRGFGDRSGAPWGRAFCKHHWWPAP